jgi:hypothetical protein
VNGVLSRRPREDKSLSASNLLIGRSKGGVNNYAFWGTGPEEQEHGEGEATSQDLKRGGHKRRGGVDRVADCGELFNP